MVSMQIAALMVALAGNGETVLLDFSASWCAPCRGMEPTVAELQRAGYPVRKVDIDRERALAAQYHVESIPCFVLVVNGQEAGRVVGSVPRAELIGLFTKAGVGRGANPAQVARAQSPDALRPSVTVPSEPRRDPFSSRSAPRIPGTQVTVTDANAAAAVSMQDLVQASVRLTIHDPQGSSYGSGTMIDSRQGEALILTCGHIFRDSQGKGQIMVDLFGSGAPQKVPGRLVAFDLNTDIGLVSIKPGVPVRVAPVAPKGHPVAKGDKVVSVGCNNGGPATALESKITAINKFGGTPNVEIAGLPVQGRSGGGLFNAEGLVIGVCNAADPADNEGLYAALPAIQSELDEVGLTALYRDRTSAAPAQLAGATPPPEMPSRMPEPAFATRGSAAAQAPAAGDAASGLKQNEAAALAQMRDGDTAEVICIVRSLNDPNAKSEVITLDRASTQFLQQLAADRQAQESRHLTSLNVRPQIKGRTAQTERVKAR